MAEDLSQQARELIANLIREGKPVPARYIPSISESPFETELKIKGLWNDYEKHIINSDIDGIINVFNIWIDEEINGSNTSYVTEAGDVERWVGSSKQKLLENKEETIKYLQNLKK